ncbi:iron-sulfur cluster assembly accessory protein [Paraburkholderia sp. CNPSo 3272]|uniref:HesB/IscA family protein n=1 Tax=Paraburkholderia sp. CNPSo 3272 TaxID=2940931 RepID=UPI0020B7029C|nr:iron-sulfur cluster biosynthesis family protein [Paraburkholderia sp. CNPSo 3272]MCP3724561.1 iron-sulfur cluster assembly accessory protein [Paraburkholderia sp. CNPSo 3272]
MLPNFAVTPAAEKFLHRIVRFSGLPSGAGVRICVSTGGCSGYEAELSAVADAQPGDETTEINGLRIFLSAESRLLLDGFTVDFVETQDRCGLAFNNGNQAFGVAARDGAGKSSVSRIDASAIGRGLNSLPREVS